MSKKFQLSHIAALVIGLGSVAFSSAVLADPPSRVARLGYTSGSVSFSPAGDDDWVLAKLNRPLITGDRLWVDGGGRDELQIGNASLRMAGDTSVSLLNLDDSTSQVQVSQGVVILHVRRLDDDEMIEIDTPNLAFSIQAPGDYRINVDPRNDTTTISIRSGEGEAFGESESYNLDAGRSYRFEGSDLGNYEDFSLARSDDFDRWSAARDLRLSRSNSARYVSRDIVGYEDLDEHGSWTTVANYGNVWVPSHVAADWAPYRDGHWSWVEPWGWTWVDNAPWGFAVSHYGRWANTGNRWCWVPGPIAARPVYAPALVAFVGGNNFRVSVSSGNVGGVAWFPLAPREVYRPAYHVSRDYFANINTSNTIVNRTTVTNVYNNINVTNVSNVTYVNRQVPGALVAMPANAFVQSQQVTRAAVRVTAQEIARAPIAFNASVAPMRASLTGAAVQGMRPPAESLARAVVVRTAPPPLAPSFAARESALARNPGRPVEAATLLTIKPSVAARAAAPEIRMARPVASASESIRGAQGERNVRRNMPVASPAAPAIAPPTQPAQPQLAPSTRIAPIDRAGRSGEERQPLRGEPRPQPIPAQAPEQKNEQPVRTINIGPAPRLTAPPARPPAEPAARAPVAVPNPNDERRPIDRAERTDRTDRLARPARVQEVAPPPAPAPVQPARPAQPAQPAAEQLVAPPIQRQLPRPEAAPAQRAMPAIRESREAPPAQRVEPERRQPAANAPAARPAPAEVAQPRREQRGEAREGRPAARQGEKDNANEAQDRGAEEMRSRK